MVNCPRHLVSRDCETYEMRYIQVRLPLTVTEALCGPQKAASFHPHRLSLDIFAVTRADYGDGFVH